MELGPIANCVEEVEFKVAQNKLVISRLAKLVHCLQQQLKQGVVFNMLGGELFNQLNSVKSVGGKL